MLKRTPLEDDSWTLFNVSEREDRWKYRGRLHGWLNADWKGTLRARPRAARTTRSPSSKVLFFTDWSTAPGAQFQQN